jgi:hypothetical protein
MISVTEWQQLQHKQENLEIDEKSCLSFLRPNYSKFSVQVLGGDMTSPKFRKQLVRDLTALSQEEIK